jgi:hypothetical protein
LEILLIYTSRCPSEHLEEQEYFIEELATSKGIVIQNGAVRNEFTNQILQNSNIEISIISEMSPCPSCAGVVDQFNRTSKELNSLSNIPPVKSGVRY